MKKRITIELREIYYSYYLTHFYKGEVKENNHILYRYWSGETSHHYHTKKRFNVFVNENKDYLCELIAQNKNELIVLLYEDYLTKQFYLDSRK